jgi:hypothetical protein
MTESGSFDSGSVGGGSFDSGSFDSGSFDSGSVGGASFDGGSSHSGSSHGGSSHGGSFDGGHAGHHGSGSHEGGHHGGGHENDGMVESYSSGSELPDAPRGFDRRSGSRVGGAGTSVAGVAAVIPALLATGIGMVFGAVFTVVWASVIGAPRWLAWASDSGVPWYTTAVMVAIPMIPFFVGVLIALVSARRGRGASLPVIAFGVGVSLGAGGIVATMLFGWPELDSPLFGYPFGSGPYPTGWATYGPVDPGPEITP